MIPTSMNPCYIDIWACCNCNVREDSKEVDQCIFLCRLQPQETKQVRIKMSLFIRHLSTSMSLMVCVCVFNMFDNFEHACKICRLLNTGWSCILLICNDLLFCIQVYWLLDCLNLGMVSVTPRNSSWLVGDGSSCCNIKIAILPPLKVYSMNKYLLLIILELSLFYSFGVTHQEQMTTLFVWVNTYTSSPNANSWNLNVSKILSRHFLFCEPCPLAFHSLTCSLVLYTMH